MCRLAACVGPHIPLKNIVTVPQHLLLFQRRTPMILKCLPMEMALVSCGMVQILNQAFIEFFCQPGLMKIS